MHIPENKVLRPLPPEAGFNGRVNGFTRVDSARPVVDQ